MDRRLGEISQEPQAPSELSQLQIRLEHAAAALSESVVNLRNANDRALGSEGKGSDSARGPQPVPAGMLGDCNVRVDVINSLIEQLSDEINRTGRIA